MKLNIINYNEFSRNIKHWNPYEEEYNHSFVENNELYILGPINNENMRYLWNFSIKITSNNIIKISSIQNTKTEDPCIDIEIKNKVGKINYINKCGDYKGKDLINWMIEIMKKMGCEKCILQDMSEIKCNHRNRDNYVPLSLIHKLWKGTTYYEDFGFVPYHRNNSSYTNNILLKINTEIKSLQNSKWNSYHINDKKYNEFKNKYNLIYPSPFAAFKEFSPDNCGIFYDILDLLENDAFLLENDKLYEIKQLISKSVWMKVL